MDYYSVLGVDKTSSQTEIKQAYRKLAMKHHPDRGGDASTLTTINEAYETLGNESKRAEYDNPQQGFRSGDFYHNFDEGFFRQRVRRNGNTAISVTIALADVITGKEMLASYRVASGEEQTVELKIPIGIQSGQVLRYRGLGDNSVPGPRGDLLVKIVVREEANWTRQGDNLVLYYKLNALDMITGTKIRIETLDNKHIELKIPQGTKTDTKFSVAEYGMPNAATHKRGSLYIHIVPEITKIEDQELLDQIRSYRNAASKST
jgi:curved DNA-binding protein